MTPTATVHIFEHRVRFWKRATAGAMTLAASLLAFVAVRESSRMSNGKFSSRFWKPAHANRRSSPLSMSKKRTLALRRIAPAPKPGRSYELWAIAGANAPKSLGLVDLDANLLRDSRGKAARRPRQIRRYHACGNGRGGGWIANRSANDHADLYRHASRGSQAALTGNTAAAYVILSTQGYKKYFGPRLTLVVARKDNPVMQPV